MSTALWYGHLTNQRSLNALNESKTVSSAWLFLVSVGGLHLLCRGMPPSADLRQLIDVPTLEGRRKRAAVLFVHDLLSGRLDCPDLLARLPLNCPNRRLRHHDVFYTPTHRTNYAHFSPLSNLIREFNLFSGEHDYGQSRREFLSATEGRL